MVVEITNGKVFMARVLLHQDSLSLADTAEDDRLSSLIAICTDAEIDLVRASLCVECSSDTENGVRGGLLDVSPIHGSTMSNSTNTKHSAQTTAQTTPQSG